MNYRYSLALVIACLAGVGAVESAAPPPPPPEGLEAAEAFLEKRFKQLDLDGDGRLSVEEAKPVEKWLRGADANHDGFLTMDEIRAHLRARLGEFVEGRRALAGGAPAESPKLDEPPAPLYAAQDSPREEPRRLRGADCGISALVPDTALADLDGRAHSLHELTHGKAAVIALVSTTCPVSKRYLPTLARLEQAHPEVAWLLVAPDATEASSDLQAAVKAAGLHAPIFRSSPQQLAGAQLLPIASTDVFLLDAAHTLIYRGAIDDQYGLGYSREAPRQRYLTQAFLAVQAGTIPDVVATEAPGCLLEVPATSTSSAAELTYHRRISRLLQANCLECHHTGGIAPFALETYDQVAAKSAMIRKMVERRLMPPWFAAPPSPGQHSPWGNDRSLAERDRSDLLAWLAAGRPVGDERDSPLPRHFASDWALGQPDAIVQIATPVAVKADGTMPYQQLTVETSFPEDRWVRGLEIRPTAPEVVHHVLVFLQGGGAPSGGFRTRFSGGGDGDEREGFFAAYVPGNSHVLYPAGFAKLLPAGAKLRFQIHYTPNGTATSDQTRLGFIFAPEPPQHLVRVAGITEHRINIPPGAERFPVTAMIPVPADVKLLSFTPHMHLRGAAFRYEAILPNGVTNTLLDVPRYDFNWQLSYRYAEPPTLPAGSRIRATGWFDNSTNNPANPDSTKTVHWGPQTFDEMMLGFVEFYVPGEKPPVKTAAR